MALVTVENLTYYYPGAMVPALDNVNLEIKTGEFLLVIGNTGSGKSTLLRAIHGLVPEFYGGRFQGRIMFAGRDRDSLDRRQRGETVGMVFQSPDNQLVMNRVEKELAFGLENLGYPPAVMHRRVAETAAALGLTPWLHRYTSELSGGIGQRVALASVLAMQPPLLLVDEPTSELDPVAAEELLGTLQRLNQENGLTIVMVEQRLERCFHLVDRVLVMKKGRVVQGGSPGKIACRVAEEGEDLIPPIPAVFARAGYRELPLTVKEGIQALHRQPNLTVSHPASPPGEKQAKGAKKSSIIEVNHLWYTYPGGNEVLKDISFKANPGEFWAILGENAAGKSTFLKCLAGLLKPGRGSVRVMERDTRDDGPGGQPGVGFLSQNPGDYLFRPTVREELQFTLQHLSRGESRGKVEATLEELGLVDLASCHPRDLSAGERQRVALASVLVARPSILLLDEPTRGLDYRLKRELGELLAGLASSGVTVILVTHDVEFAAEYADQAALLAGGRWVGMGPTREVLTGSSYYSPQVNKMLRHLEPNLLTRQEAVDLLLRLRSAKDNPARRIVRRVMAND